MVAQARRESSQGAVFGDAQVGQGKEFEGESVDVLCTERPWGRASLSISQHLLGAVGLRQEGEDNSEDGLRCLRVLYCSRGRDGMGFEEECRNYLVASAGVFTVMSLLYWPYCIFRLLQGQREIVAICNLQSAIWTLQSWSLLDDGSLKISIFQ